MSTKKDKPLTARVTEEHVKKLKRILDSKGITYSQWLRKTIEGLRG